MFAPEAGKFSAAAERHSSFVSSISGGIELACFIPKQAQHLHTFCIIPYGCRDDAACFGRAYHFAHRFRAIRDEIDHQKRQRPIELAISESKLLRIAHPELNTAFPMTHLRKGHIRGGWINADDTARWSDSSYAV